jgi:preprotein translocase subunit SecF
MIIFYNAHGDFIKKDISLTGGTSVEIYDKLKIDKLKIDLSSKLPDLKIREIYDLTTREQKAIVIETTADGQTTKKILEDYFGYSLTDSNSSFEFTGALLSQSIYVQLLLAVLYAFLLMGWVIFILFSKSTKFKVIISVITILNPLLFFFRVLSLNYVVILALVSIAISFFIYFKSNIPSFIIVMCAFADILMTLTVVNLLGIKVSTAGIVAFLMLIGYSIDTDILLTNRLLKKKTEDPINKTIFGAFKTGITMTLTAIATMIISLLIVSSFSQTLTQIFMIILIGLFFDILNTWITNASVLKWYIERKQKHGKEINN